MRLWPFLSALLSRGVWRWIPLRDGFVVGLVPHLITRSPSAHSFIWLGHSTYYKSIPSWNPLPHRNPYSAGPTKRAKVARSHYCSRKSKQSIITYPICRLDLYAHFQYEYIGPLTCLTLTFWMSYSSKKLYYCFGQKLKKLKQQQQQKAAHES